MPTGKYKRTEKHRIAFKEAIKKRKYKYKGGYDAIHWWLNNHFGKADKCENADCNFKNTKRYEYALLKGKRYEYKRENFIKLCKSCHIKYDATENGREKVRQYLLGRKQTIEHIKKRVSKLIGKKMTEENKLKMGERKKGKPCLLIRKKCYQHDLNNRLVKIWNSQVEPSAFYKLSVSNISLCCSGKQKTAKGFIWKNKLDDTN